MPPKKFGGFFILSTRGIVLKINLRLKPRLQ